MNRGRVRYLLASTVLFNFIGCFNPRLRVMSDHIQIGICYVKRD